MSTLKEKLYDEVAALLNEGVELHNAEAERQGAGKLKKKVAEDKELPLNQFYHAWYTKALPVVKQILPDRYQEFVEQYKLDKRKQIDFVTYTISDYLIGLRVTRGYAKEEVVNAFSAFSNKFQQQVFILRSCLDRLDSFLANIEGTLQAELFDDELSAAEELHKKGHLRAAGALAGVTLERHLANVAQSHGIKITKKDPAIADYNEALKSAGVYDIPNWRFVQRLGDFRNLSVHFKNREPTKEEIDEMIKGVQKVVKTIF